MKKLITGNEAIAHGALRAGIKVAAGYPGTPSTGCLTALLAMNPKDTHVEWSVNEKVALEIASAAAWAGHRALCTMKMSGLNVAYDTLVSVAYSGCTGGLVVYVADDPGANAGMCEQDTRGFAVMTDMPMLEPASVPETYTLTKYAFELSERIGGPVFIRLVTAIADSFAVVDVEEPGPVSNTAPLLIRDINKYTKAGSLIATNQHRELIARLAHAEECIAAAGINRLALSPAGKPGGLGMIASGMAAAYLDEGFEMAAEYGFRREETSLLTLKTAIPLPAGQVRALLGHCGIIVVLEELEPVVEKGVYIEAQRMGWTGKIIGKLDGTFSRVGEYGVGQVARGVDRALNLNIPESAYTGRQEALKAAAARPITVCAGCPHRGTFIAIDKAIKKSKLKKNEVMVTGDIGCTILGMNPPFDLVWNEVSMGASISLAQGYVHAGVKTPVIATIGDSTFFHAGIPGLLNAIQHKVDLTLVIMDNRWTAMTGMQINPGTPCSTTTGYEEIDIAKIVPALGVEHFWTANPFQVEEMAGVVREAMALPGVKVILARQECAIQAQRQGKMAGGIPQVIAEKCNLCKLCLMVTGCSAITLGVSAVEIEPELCYGCGICIDACHRGALIEEAA